MPDLPDFTPETATAEVPQSRVSGGAVERSADAIPEGLDKLGQGLEELATPIAAQEGSAAAARMSITRAPDGSLNVATPDNSFIMGQAGDAYAEAATQGALAKLHTQIDTDMVGIAQQYKANPPGFQAASKQYLSQLSSSANPVDMHAAEYGAQVAAQHYDGLVDDLGRIDTQAAYKSGQDRLSQIEDGMDGLAAQGGTDTPQFKAYANERQSILNGFVSNPLYGYNAQQKDNDENQFQTRMTSAAAVGAARNVYSQTHNLTQAVSVLNDKIDQLPMSETQKIRLQGEITEHMRGMDAVWQQGNDDLRNTARTVVTQGMADGHFDPGTVSQLVGQLTSRKLYAEAANVEGAATFSQYKPAFNPSGTAEGWATAYNNFQGTINKQTQAVVGQTRGLRNNNPGNLVDDAWTRSLPGYTGSDGRFAQFSTPQQGQAALDLNLQNYSRRGAQSPLQIASRWAPAGDGGNDPNAYGASIAKEVGVGLNDQIDLTNPAVRSKVASAITKVENGSGTVEASGEVAPALSVYVKQAQTLYNGHFNDVWGPVKKALDAGQMPSTQEISDLKTLAPYVTDSKVLGEVQDTFKVAGTMQTFKRLPVSQQQDIASTMGIAAQNGGLDAINRQVAGQMKTQADHSANLAANDAVSYAYNVLPPAVQKSLPSLDFDVTQPDQFAQGLKAGQAWKNTALKLDPSISNQGVLTDVKRQQIAAAMPGMNSQQVGGILSGFSGLQPQELNAEMSVKSTRDAIVGLTRSGDYGKMNSAYGFLDQLQRQNPTAFEAQFGGDVFKNLRVWQAKSAFEPPDQIAQEMTNVDDPSMQKAKEALRQQADDQLKNVDGAAVARKFGSSIPFFGRTPDVMTATPAASLEAMRQDYSGFYRDMYAEVGDSSKADAYAVERLGQKYGVSGVNGGRLMAYPPDKLNADGTGAYYPKINGGFDWINAQARDAVGRIADSMLPPTGDDETYSANWRAFVNAPRALIGDTTTQAEIASHRPPSYQIVMQDPNGNLRVMSDPTGKPFRFRPDPAPALAQSRADFEAQREGDAQVNNLPAPPGL